MSSLKAFGKILVAFPIVPTFVFLLLGGLSYAAHTYYDMSHNTYLTSIGFSFLAALFVSSLLFQFWFPEYDTTSLVKRSGGEQCSMSLQDDIYGMERYDWNEYRDADNDR